MSEKPKSSNEVKVEKSIEKKAPAKKSMKVGDISKCGMWEVKSIGEFVDMVPSKDNKQALGVVTKVVADAEAMMG